MVTSIRDLLDQVDQLAARDATECSADVAVAALGHLARALATLDEHRFAAPGVHTAAARRRHLACANSRPPPAGQRTAAHPRRRRQTPTCRAGAVVSTAPPA